MCTGGVLTVRPAPLCQPGPLPVTVLSLPTQLPAVVTSPADSGLSEGKYDNISPTTNI